MHEDDLSGTRLGQLAQRARALGIDPTGLDRDELIEEINAMGHDDSSELAQRQMREAEPAR